MKITATKAFWDKVTGQFVGKGQDLDVIDERGNDLVAKGLCVKKGAKAPKDEIVDESKEDANVDNETKTTHKTNKKK